MLYFLTFLNRYYSYMGVQKQTIMEPTERTTNLNQICRFILFLEMMWMMF